MIINISKNYAMFHFKLQNSTHLLRVVQIARGIQENLVVFWSQKSDIGKIFVLLRASGMKFLRVVAVP